MLYIPSFMKIGPLVLEKKIFEGFLPYMGVAFLQIFNLKSLFFNLHDVMKTVVITKILHWSCDPDAANKILFPLPKEAPHKIWL